MTTDSILDASKDSQFNLFNSLKTTKLLWTVKRKAKKCNFSVTFLCLYGTPPKFNRKFGATDTTTYLRKMHFNIIYKCFL